MEMDFVSPQDALRINPVYTSKDPPLEMSVVIRNAVSPWNFHVTDYRTSKCLEQLETGMTEWYDAYEKGGRHLDEIELGGFYAVKYVSDNSTTNKWLRCEIVKPFKKDLSSFTCRLVDNGAFYHAPLENFFKLRRNYCALPIQGIVATLHAFDGTKPGSRHLGAEECRKFYERVEGRHFYSFVLNSSESLKEKGTLRLILVDTAGERNGYIHEEFNLKLETNNP